MIYDFMRLILFFDLPVVSKEDRRIYATFRKYLIKNGYIMMQYSVYCKIFANREAAVKHVNILQRNVPQKGQIRILLVTEKPTPFMLKVWAYIVKSNSLAVSALMHPAYCIE